MAVTLPTVAGASVGAALVKATGDAGGGETQATTMTRAIRGPAKRLDCFLESIRATGVLSLLHWRRHGYPVQRRDARPRSGGGYS